MDIDLSSFLFRLDVQRFVFLCILHTRLTTDYLCRTNDQILLNSQRTVDRYSGAILAPFPR